jgi:hypothetical protein
MFSLTDIRDDEQYLIAIPDGTSTFVRGRKLKKHVRRNLTQVKQFSHHAPTPRGFVLVSVDDETAVAVRSLHPDSPHRAENDNSVTNGFRRNVAPKFGRRKQNAITAVEARMAANATEPRSARPNPSAPVPTPGRSFGARQTAAPAFASAAPRRSFGKKS